MTGVIIQDEIIQTSFTIYKRLSKLIMIDSY